MTQTFSLVYSVSTAPKELREVDLTAKMSKSKKKKLKKRQKRNQQLMDETLEHIVREEKQQLEQEGQPGEEEQDVINLENQSGESKMSNMENGEKVTEKLTSDEASVPEVNGKTPMANGQKSSSESTNDLRENYVDSDAKVASAEDNCKVDGNT